MPGGGRVPPHDEGAEQSVLGSMMLSKDAIADVVETVRGADFYRPAHELIYDAVLDLYGRGEPADAVTVAAELTRAGDIARVGGAPYLHTLVALVPVAANAGFYAGIVREKAILRRLVDAGTKIVQIGYAGEGQVDDVVDQAQAEVYAVTERRASEDYAPLSAILEQTIDELDAIGNRDGAMAGVPTGFAELDDVTNGLHGGQMVIVAARPAIGKALALDTRLPTPSGWTTMNDVAVGDELIGTDGRPTRIVGATEVLTGRPCYRVEFSDGSAIVADALHEWLTECDFEAEVRTTVALADELAQGRVHVVRSAAPLCGQAALTHWTAPRLECGVDAGWKIVAVAPVDSVPVRCVEVDASDHLYLAGRSMIPTHNSALGLDIARSASIRNGLASVIFSLEMSRTEITMRLLSAEARIPMQHMRNGSMSDDDWGRLVRKMSEVSAAP
ncbi:MAG TPA: DnaB-like helicase N-terminal domain-containing protein, partial [Nocardioidaceae bacterium]|nr:DnaB-like helicase N-terminal domain-containing protein [Nocardioidaceae bacterium]